MLKLCICDDKTEDLERSRTLVEDFVREYPEFPIHIQEFSSPYDLLEYVEGNGGFDLYLLDILMPHMSGLELAQCIRKRGETADLLFLTCSREYALDAFGVSASGYLLKPLEKDAFDRTLLASVRRLTSADTSSLLLKSREGIRKIQLRELVLVESFNHRRVCTLTDGSRVETTDTLSSLMAQLSGDGRFISPHRAYIVNLEFINDLTATEALMEGGRRVPVSRNLYKTLKVAYMDYIFLKMRYGIKI